MGRVREAFNVMGSSEVAEVIAAGIGLFPDGLVPEDELARARLIDDGVDAERVEALGVAYERLIASDAYLESQIERLAEKQGL